ncbi:MAG: RNA 2',3'-cyclic phosphodiesterase [archaeon]
MRSFISIDIPEDVQEEIIKIQEQLPEFVGKKTECKNIHLTLKFLGEVDELKVNEIKRRLKEINFEKFEAEIDSIGVFSEKFIRIIWLHLTNCDKLQKIIDGGLKGLFEKEKRFMSHLTIARVKNIRDKKKFLDELRNVKLPEMRFNVDYFELKSSILRKEGPDYFTIEKYRLKSF